MLRVMNSTDKGAGKRGIVPTAFRGLLKNLLSVLRSEKNLRANWHSSRFEVAGGLQAVARVFASMSTTTHTNSTDAMMQTYWTYATATLNSATPTEIANGRNPSC